MSYFDDRLPRRRRGRNGSVWATLLVLVTSIAIMLMAFLPTPYVIERPGGAYNVLGSDDGTPIIQISGAPTYQTEGGLELMTIEIWGSPEKTPSWLDLFFAWMDPSQSVIPLEEIYPPSTTKQQVDQQSTLMMADSQKEAVAAALRELGYKFGSHLSIQGVSTNTPADGVLELGDQPLEVNGNPVAEVQQVIDFVEGSNGDVVSLKVLRKGKELTLNLIPKQIDGDYRLGILLGYDYDFPVDVKLQIQDVGGPSGGMIFALGIYDKLTPGALTGGEVIAGTGTISADGEVGPIGGIREKLYTGIRAGARYFLAPESNCAETVGHVPSGLTVLKVSTFKQAIAAVKAIADGKADTLAKCEAN